ncbi:cutinase family protein [Rhodococcus spongiicola]|uniref:Cutinase family protein n=1 Tax=Rhodococcus spongiicola TaxID=2487352 RepID=A0A3S3CPE0_9NOCA|nr:cutinase family protein [Rhodococcus spongiicola]RVW02440.1 cutinase family protein [Rhodococcus spongiicola]
MIIRRLFSQRGAAARVLTSVAVAVALLVTLTWALWSSPTRTVDTALVASTTDCKDMVTLSIAGRGDTPRPGTTKMLVDENGNELPAASADDYVSTWIDQASSAPLAEVGRDSYAAMYIAYPADMSSYEDAVTTGVANTKAVMEAIQASCPDTQFAIVGYSEGADVARRVAQDVGHQEPDADGTYEIVDPADVLGVVILADAGRVDGQGPFPGAENPFTNPDGFDLEYQSGGTAVPGQGALPDTGGDDFGALNGRIASFCADGDLTCAAPENISLLQLVVNVGRQLDVDALEREQLTPATGIDVATVMSRIALDAFADISSQPDWMQSDETFLDVLLKVSDPSYAGPTAEPTTEPATPETDASDISDVTLVSGEEDSISTEEMSPLAYLPQKLFKEIVGLIVTNQNTIPVIMSDPYQLTLAPEVGHHFDYWRDADPANGQELTSADYAAAWLTYLAQQAQAGQPVDPKATPSADELSAAMEALSLEESVTTSEAAAAPSLAATPSGAVQPAETTPAPTLPTTTPGAAPTTTTPAPSAGAETATAEPTQTAVTPETTATPTTSVPAETTVASEATTSVTAPVPTPAG